MKGISVLIPVHEYNPTPLVRALHKQCATLSIAFEIIIYDDCSSYESYIPWKQDLHNTINLHIYRLDKNIGRASIRNELIKKASFDWLLLLDVDTLPCTEDYIKKYLPFLTTENTCVCGGTAYFNTPPEAHKILRWKYGKAREEISAKKRNSHPFETFTLNNLLIRKKIIQHFPLDASIKTYGHEDTLLGMTLAENGVQIIHIDNFVFHEGLDTNEVFLEKVKQSINTLIDLHKQNKLPSQTKLIKLHATLTKLKLNNFITACIKPFIPAIEKNLLSSTPSMFYMDVYKLWYFEECLNR